MANFDGDMSLLCLLVQYLGDIPRDMGDKFKRQIGDGHNGQSDRLRRLF
ncbi:hypothetical protein [Methanolobus vulcani]|nr:hypothetical protein [Methanolobus vulcani]